MNITSKKVMRSITRTFFFLAIGVLFFSADFDEATQFNFKVIQDAEAVVGRPLTPVSVAGVRRRTRRRTAVATAAVVATPVVVAARVVAAPVVVAPAPVVVAPAAAAVAIGTTVAVLPGGCQTLTSAGATYHSCGGVYYRPAFQSNKIVYIVVDQP